MLTSLEICSGAGGQALGLEQAGFDHSALVEIDRWACETLRLNRPFWNVVQDDIKNISGRQYAGVDLLAGGVPCPPFSIAGKQLGHLDDRNLFPEALRLVRETLPRAVMLENVRGLMAPAFGEFRRSIDAELQGLGYRPEWRLLNACDFGVSQLRPRVVLVAMRDEDMDVFRWPEIYESAQCAPTVGELLHGEMASRGWMGADDWANRACGIAPTLVGGSRKHGGPDLGPTRARRAWAELGVDGRGLADAPPTADFEGIPRLTVRMAAMVQGFPNDWQFAGGKTAAYRQVGNAFPPPVAKAMAKSIKEVLMRSRVPELRR